VFHVSIWGGLELCFGGPSPPKPPRGDGTARKSSDLPEFKQTHNTAIFSSKRKTFA